MRGMTVVGHSIDLDGQTKSQTAGITAFLQLKKHLQRRHAASFSWPQKDGVFAGHHWCECTTSSDLLQLQMRNVHHF
jgi:hypothetical protein